MELVIAKTTTETATNERPKSNSVSHHHRIVVPHEAHKHACTWMSYGVSIQVWGRNRHFIEDVKANLRAIAIAIANQNEIVHILVRPEEYQQAMNEFASDMQPQHQPQPHQPHQQQSIQSMINTDATLISHPNIILIPITSNLNDIWIRDTGPLFVHVIDDESEATGSTDHRRDGTTDPSLLAPATTTSNNIPSLGAINGNFNGWGKKQRHNYDKHVAEFIIQYINNHSTASLQSSTSPSVRCIENSTICFEGGGIEVDGKGTAILIESCILNKNRNSLWNNKDECTRILCNLLGLTKIIWLPGMLDRYDITDGHVDGFIRFVPSDNDDCIHDGHDTTPTTPPESIVVMACYSSDGEDDDDTNERARRIQSQQIQILQSSTNARNGSFRIVKLPNPSQKALQRIYKAHPEFCASYVNYYICNNHTVLVPQFNISPYDENAVQILKNAFPKTYNILPIPIHTGIACGGGGVHCVTLHQPAVPPTHRRL